MSFINKPKVRHPDLPKNELGLTRRDYEGAMSTLCAGCGHDSVTAAIIQAFWELEPAPRAAREALRHRLLVEDDGVLRQRRARLQRRARPHAVDRDRRERRQPGPALHRRVRRRRLAVDRLRPVRARDPPQREHALHLREQRRLRPHQGPVLGLRRHRHQVEEGRGEPAGADRSRASPRSASAARSSRAASRATRSSWCR